MNDENRTDDTITVAMFRDLLWRMREQAEEAHRNIDLKKAAQYHGLRDQTLFREVEDLLGPTAWESLDPATHIEWGDKAICYWTHHPAVRWPPTQKAVKIASLITRLPHEDETFVEYVARPDANWNGVTCDACRVRLPTLLRELTQVLDDVHEGIMEGFHDHPDTIRSGELYARDVAPKLTSEQRLRNATQAQRQREKTERRAARRAREQQTREQQACEQQSKALR